MVKRKNTIFIDKRKYMEKSYNIALNKSYEVEFTENYGAFKSGARTSASLPLIVKWLNKGVVGYSTSIKRAIEDAGMTELVFVKKSGKKDESTVTV